jgi:transcriptional regulator with XRE-family HTH domain
MLDEVNIDGRKIRSLRERRGWTQKDLSLKSGIDQSLISALETDRKEDVRFSTIMALARSLGVQPHQLLTSSESVPVEPTDPQISIMMRMVNNMTVEERASVIALVNLYKYQRNLANAGSKRKLRGGLRKPVANLPKQA